MSKVIQRREGASGPSTYVGDSRVRVADIALMYEALQLELVAERIREAVPHLTEPEIIAAIRYWREHPEEIAQEIERDEDALKDLKSSA